MNAQTIGQRIKQFRLARGLSQRALARAVGMSNGAIQMIETGARPNPSYETIKAVARALNVTLVDLDPDLDPNSLGAQAPARNLLIEVAS